LITVVGLTTRADAQEFRSYYVTDAVGSPVVSTDVYANAQWAEDYRPYGDRILQASYASADGDNERWFTGAPQSDITSLVYLGDRYYDPVVGRFISVDPVGVSLSGENFNRYWYGNNNPFRFVDPTGRQSSPSSDTLMGEEKDQFLHDLGITQAVPASTRQVGQVMSATGDVVVEVYKSEVGGIGLLAAWKLAKFRKFLQTDIKALQGAEFEEYVAWKNGGTRLRFKAGGREFDGEIGATNAWIQSTTYPERFKDVLKFKSDMGSYLKIARDNGKSLEFHTNQSIPMELKLWMSKKGITFVEY
jgi:RHS repeat-associated protein